MTEMNLTLKASRREVTGKKVGQLRAAGKLPVVLYGYDTENLSLEVDERELGKVYRAAGSNTLVTLHIEGGKDVKVLIHDEQHDPVTGAILHVDLYAVNMKERVETDVPLKLVGEAPAVRELEGSLVVNRHEVEISALPSDIPQELELDISVLATFDDVVRAKDLQLPTGVELLEDPETVIVSVAEPRSEEELKADLETDAAAAEQAAAAELGKEPEKPAEEGEAKEGEATPEADKGEEKKEE